MPFIDANVVEVQRFFKIIIIIRHQGNNIPVPAAVGGSPTGKCGLLPQHFHHRVNAVVVLLA